MKSMLWLRGALALTVTTVASWAIAADHRDAPGTTADPAADINDVYSWVDGDNVVLVMTVSPEATQKTKFSNAVQYVFHTESHSAFGLPGTALDIICTFDEAQAIQCWAGTDEYVTGDASVATGLGSTSKKFKVFAGLRDDPFFFNLEGFKAAAGTVITALGMEPPPPIDAAGCPSIDAATSMALVETLSTDPLSEPPNQPAKDNFAGFNTLAIVISIDKTLVTEGGKVMSVWGSTNMVGGR